MNDAIKKGMKDLGFEKRENYRIAKKLSAKFNDRVCQVLNISNKGVLLETSFPVFLFRIDDSVEFQLEIDETWMRISGIVQWTASYQEYNRVGLSILNAPSLYLDYLKRVYE